MAKGYVNVSIPEKLIEDVDKVVKHRKDWFGSRAGFVRHALAELLTKHKDALE